MESVVGFFFLPFFPLVAVFVFVASFFGGASAKRATVPISRDKPSIIPMIFFIRMKFSLSLNCSLTFDVISSIAAGDEPVLKWKLKPLHHQHLHFTPPGR